jgi:hypothetical protein
MAGKDCASNIMTKANVMMDNATFHKYPRVRKFVANVG